MKKTSFLLTVFAFLLLSFASNAQLKKDGTPDMRYSNNKTTYGNNNSTPSYNYNTNSNVRVQKGYTKSDGTTVQTHHKTNSNNTNKDNFTTSGNYNPYNGKSGTKAKDYSPEARNYGSGKQIQTGPKGGQYYINNNGNKTYVPKR